MLTARKSQILQRLLLIACGGLLVGYLGVYQPLRGRVKALDRPLAEMWWKLTKVRVSGSPDGLGIERNQIEALLWQAERLTTNYVALSNAVLGRIEAAPALRARLASPFQLVAYENERQLRLEQLQKLAADHKTTLDPARTNWFPVFNADMKHPSLLWGQLWFVDELARAALAAKVSEVRSMTAANPPARGTNDLSEPTVDEFPIRIELVGSMESVAKLLGALPLLPTEAAASGLTGISSTKPVLFFDRLLISKQPGGAPDNVALDLRVRGFLLRHPPAPVSPANGASASASPG